MPNPSHEPPASSKAPNEDLNMDVLCTFNIKIESQNSDHGCIKDQWPYPNQAQDAMESQNLEHGYTKDQCSDHMKILIKIPNPIQKLFQPKANHCKAELVLFIFLYYLDHLTAIIDGPEFIAIFFCPTLLCYEPNLFV